MKIFDKIIILVVVTILAFCYGLSIDDIKASNKYIWGEGVSTNPNRADKEALSHLISQISVQVESNFVNIIEEYSGNIEEYTEVVVNTYSNVMLNEAKMKQENYDNRFRVLRYMEKDKVQDVFDNRKIMIMDFIQSAEKAEEDYRIGDALKYYYWAFCLLKSHPNMDKIYGNNIGINQRLFIYLPTKIENILDEIDIEIKSARYYPEEKRKCILLDFSYKKHPVTNLDYVYYTGDSWTNRPTTATDGLGIVELWGAAAKDMKSVKLRIEYIYMQKSKYNIALNSVIENTYIPYFSKAEKKISSFFVSKTPKKEKVIGIALGDIAKSSPDDSSKEHKLDSNNKYIETVLSFKNAYEEKNIYKINDCSTENGKKMINKLLQYGEARPVHTGKLELQMVKLNDEYIIRSIPFKFNFPYSNREFIEDVVFILNEDAKINGINFALSNKSIKDIMDMGDRFGSIERKQQIIHFMESYKTAYCLENIDYIEKVFSDNALIIIGQSLKEADNIDSMYSERLSDDEVYYIRLNKKDFIERLRRIFKSNEVINIHFEETTVKKVNKDDEFVYGIQIAQNYYSTNYADFGYLFLMFDLNKPAEPKIYVRSWQPEKSKEGLIMGLENFTF